ncbi:hypothetical protein Tco_0926341 [Tanacetum coccineum]|uniref:Uncharacterized protein n=1 Tax=Tanacetum coccineum TaxID=301880 RepID=A0ABQ5DAC4_9ASTR
MEMEEASDSTQMDLDNPDLELDVEKNADKRAKRKTACSKRKAPTKKKLKTHMGKNKIKVVENSLIYSINLHPRLGVRKSRKPINVDSLEDLFNDDEIVKDMEYELEKTSDKLIQTWNGKSRVSKTIVSSVAGIISAFRKTDVESLSILRNWIYDAHAPLRGEVRKREFIGILSELSYGKSVFYNVEKIDNPADLRDSKKSDVILALNKSEVTTIVEKTIDSRKEDTTSDGDEEVLEKKEVIGCWLWIVELDMCEFGEKEETKVVQNANLSGGSCASTFGNGQ